MAMFPIESQLSPDFVHATPIRADFTALRQVAVPADRSEMLAFCRGTGAKEVDRYSYGYGSAKMEFVVFEGIGSQIGKGVVPVVCTEIYAVENETRGF